MNVSAAGSNPYVHASRVPQRPTPPVPTPAQPQTSAPVDADGDHDGDTAAGDRLDVRG